MGLVFPLAMAGVSIVFGLGAGAASIIVQTVGGGKLKRAQRQATQNSSLSGGMQKKPQK